MRVVVSETVSVRVSETVTVHYEAGQTYTAPRDHIERIEAAGAGKRVAAEAEPPAAEVEVADVAQPA